MTITGFIITVLVVVVAVYDLLAVMIGGVKCSVSKFIQISWLRSPVLCFCCGFLCGHWIAPMNYTPEEIEVKKEIVYVNHGQSLTVTSR